MLTRGNRLDLAGLRNYLKEIIKEFVEKPGKVRVTTPVVSERNVRYHVNVHVDDLPIVETLKSFHTSLQHIMNKATKANIGKGGALDDQFGETP
jgi:hypothetical protein